MTSELLPGRALRIAQVANLTGVGVHTLRAWERRHGIPAPARTDGRQRLYAEVDIALIRVMRDLAAQGVPLGLAASRARIEVSSLASPGAPAADLQRQRLALALLSFDESAARIAWGETIEVFDLLTAFDRVVVPVLTGIGDGWHAGSVSVAQEHFASGFIRGQLETLSRQVTPLPGSPTVVLGCMQGDSHELGVLLLAVLLRFQGMRTIYLGQDVPPEAFIRAVEDTHPAVLAVSAGSPTSARLLPGIARILLEVAPRTALVYGGRAFDIEPNLRLPEGAHYGGSGLADALTLLRNLAHSGDKGALP